MKFEITNWEANRPVAKTEGRNAEVELGVPFVPFTQIRIPASLGGVDMRLGNVESIPLNAHTAMEIALENDKDVDPYVRDILAIAIAYSNQMAPAQIRHEHPQIKVGVKMAKNIIYVENHAAGQSAAQEGAIYAYKSMNDNKQIYGDRYSLYNTALHLFHEMLYEVNPNPRDFVLSEDNNHVIHMGK